MQRLIFLSKLILFVCCLVTNWVGCFHKRQQIKTKPENEYCMSKITDILYHNLSRQEKNQDVDGLLSDCYLRELTMYFTYIEYIPDTSSISCNFLLLYGRQICSSYICTQAAGQIYLNLWSETVKNPFNFLSAVPLQFGARRLVKDQSH